MYQRTEGLPTRYGTVQYIPLACPTTQYHLESVLTDDGPCAHREDLEGPGGCLCILSLQCSKVLYMYSSISTVGTSPPVQ